MTAGERIRQKRKELNLSQDDLAKKVGYKSRSSIQKIECARKLPLNKVEVMAHALNCTPGFLMGWEDEEGNKAEQPEASEVDTEESARAKMLMEIFKNSDPVLQESIVNLLTATLPKP